MHRRIGGVDRGWDTNFTKAKEAEGTGDDVTEDERGKNEEGKGRTVEDLVEELTRDLEEELRLDKEEDIEVKRVEDSEISKKDEDEKALKSDTWDDKTVIVEKKKAPKEDEESAKEVKEKL